MKLDSRRLRDDGAKGLASARCLCDRWITKCLPIEPGAEVVADAMRSGQPRDDPCIGATLADLCKSYANGGDDLPDAHHMTASIWNNRMYPSDVVKVVHSDITVQDWIKLLRHHQPNATGIRRPSDRQADQDYLYYYGGNPSLPNATPPNIWEHFDPGRLSGGERLPGGAGDPHLAGIQFSLRAGPERLPARRLRHRSTSHHLPDGWCPRA